MSIAEEQRIEIQKLLPFWLNGTLSEDEYELVAAALASDADLKREVEQLESIRSVIHSEVIERSPGEMGLARLRRDINSYRRGAAAPLPARSRYGVLAASVVLALVGGFALFMSQNREPIYLQASGGDPAAALTVEFRSEATVDQISDLLLEHDLIIVDGPSALRLFRLGVRNEDELERIAADLRARVGIIEFIEEAN